MWMAVCAHKDCQWDQSTDSQATAEAHLTSHIEETGHRGAVVKLPEQQPQQRVVA